MKRYIRYLYEYENGVRARNVGFVKVEEGDGECVMHIHGKGLGLNDRKDVELYVFYKDQDQCIGIPQGRISDINPALNYRLKLQAEDTGAELFDRIQGIILADLTRPRFAAVWNDQPVDISKMKVQDKRRAPAASRQQDEEAAAQALRERTQKPQVEPPAAVAEPAVEREPVKKPVESPKAPERPVKLEMPIPPKMVTEPDHREVEAVVPETEMEEAVAAPADKQTQPTWQCKKIKREGIAELPRREWCLANNSFLLHGYTNYHHLLLIDEEQGTWIGVPGIYHEREQAVASSFGFSRFVDSNDCKVGLEDGEKEAENFGYWCRQVSRHQV